jgi:diguanylate cyclase (GGDEF)-like protein
VTFASAPAPAGALRQARQAWRSLHTDAPASLARAERVLARADAPVGSTACAWAMLTLGFHRLYFATPGEAMPTLAEAQRQFDALAHRSGHVLAGAGLARSLWRGGRYREALDAVLPLRDEGLRLLEGDDRGLLLNTIAGCYSVQGQSDQAFAYMYQALREAGPARGRGIVAMLYCNLAHELLQLGDYEEALRNIEFGLESCAGLNNPRLLSALLINRVICLTDLERPAEALPDIARVLAVPTDASGRGAMCSHFETMAITALRAGDVPLGLGLMEKSGAAVQAPIADEQLERQIARAELARVQGERGAAAQNLRAGLALAKDGADGLSLRVRCRYFHTLAELHESDGESAPALAALRTWQTLHVERAAQASRARYQAAALQTELLRLQLELERSNASRRTAERAKTELESSHSRLMQKIDEVEHLQVALRQQAARDYLTGLFNRRHLEDVLPSMLALAQRDQQPLAVAMIDLDHFKMVNDMHGHAAGDAMLKSFGELLTKQGRKSDVACRYGGEEFCLLLPRTDAHAARRKLNSLLALWRGAEFHFGVTDCTANTFSAGVADSFLAPQTPADLLRAADGCLLEAKRLGRHRVLVFDSVAANPQAIE